MMAALVSRLNTKIRPVNTDTLIRHPHFAVSVTVCLSGSRSRATDESQPPGTTASPPAADPGSSDAAVVDQDILPGVAAAEMLLKPLVDSCIPGVLAIRANVLHLRRPIHP